MSDRAKAAKVGIFTFVTGALLAIVLVVFGGLKFWKHKDRYYIDVDGSVMGLSDGTQVYFEGIHIGSVAKVELDPDEPSHVRIAIDVERGSPIRTDTVAMIDMAGITGLKVVDLRGGSAKAGDLPPLSHIPAGVGTLDKLQKQAEKIADQTGEMVTRAKQIMDGANKIITDVSAVTDPQALGAIVEASRQTTANLAMASKAINEMVAENRAALKGAFVSVGKTTDNANQLAADLRTLIHSNQGTITSTLADLRQAARTFKDLAREVREKPSRLMFSDAAPERKLP